MATSPMTSPAAAMLTFLALGGLGLVPSVASADDGDQKRALVEAKLEVVKRAFARSEQLLAAPRPRGEAIMRPSIELERLALWSRRWMDAERQLATDQDARLDAIRGHIARLERAVKVAKVLVEGGPSTEVGPGDVDNLDFELLDARCLLLEAQAE